MTPIVHHDDRPQRLQGPVQLCAEPFIHPHNRLVNCQLGAFTEVMSGCLLEDLEMGDWSYLGGGNDMISCTIGRFASIASGVRINPGMHPMHQPCQHHVMYRASRYGLGEDDAAFFAQRRAQRVHIGHDVWIGHNALIMPGVRIGHGAVIGSCAVVTKDVEDFQIVVGTPAAPLRYRFDAETRAYLLRCAWWDWSNEEIMERRHLLADLAALRQAFP